MSFASMYISKIKISKYRTKYKRMLYFLYLKYNNFYFTSKNRNGLE